MNNEIITVEQVRECDAALKAKINTNFRGFIDNLTAVFYQRDALFAEKQLKAQYRSIVEDQVACERYANLLDAVYAYGSPDNEVTGKMRYYYADDLKSLDKKRVTDSLAEIYEMLREDRKIGSAAGEGTEVQSAKSSLKMIGKILGVDLARSAGLEQK